MKIFVGTSNKGKIECVREVFEKYKDVIRNKNADNSVEISGIKVESKVSELPTSDDEMIEGAINRAKFIMKNNKCDFAVGIEGGIDKNKFGTFIHAWAVIIDKNGSIGIGCGPRLMLPKRHENISDEKELIKITESLSGMKHSHLKQKGGLIGILSMGKTGRMDNIKNAIEHALIPLISPYYNGL